MKNEETILDQFPVNPDKDPKAKEVEAKEGSDAKAAKEGGKGKASLRKAAAGMGAGILLGGAASLGLAHAAPPDGDDLIDIDPDDQTPAWSDGDVEVATSVSDEMSFSEAFAAARAEVGPGGAFEWHGNVYGTFTAEEWESMTPEERQEYNSHFSWNQHHGSDREVTADESEEAGAGETNNEDTADESEEAGAGETNPEDTADESEAEVIGEPNPDGAPNPDDPADELGETIPGEVTDDISDPQETADELVSVDDTPEVEILGLIQDDESGANIGEVIVDGQEVYLIDVDGDGGTFDYMASDLNNDGVLTPDEIVDISEENIGVDYFDNSFSEDAMFDSGDDELDYLSDDILG